MYVLYYLLLHVQYYMYYQGCLCFKYDVLNICLKHSFKRMFKRSLFKTYCFKHCIKQRCKTLYKTYYV